MFTHIHQNLTGVEVLIEKVVTNGFSKRILWVCSFNSRILKSQIRKNILHTQPRLASHTILLNAIEKVLICVQIATANGFLRLQLGQQNSISPRIFLSSFVYEFCKQLYFHEWIAIKQWLKLTFTYKTPCISYKYFAWSTQFLKMIVSQRVFGFVKFLIIIKSAFLSYR